MHTLSKIDSYFSTYQTGVFSWQPHTFLQESVKQTMVWASQQLFWNIQPSSFLLNKMWWLFVVNVILGQIHQTFGGLFILKWHFMITVSAKNSEYWGSLTTYKSIFHSITEWLGLEGISKIIQFQPPCCGQSCQPLDQTAHQAQS